jgi:signal transduction histidine kinase
VLDGVVLSLLGLGLVDVVLQPSDLPLAERLAVIVLLPLPLLLRHRRPVEAMLGLQLLLVLGSAHGTHGGLGSQAWIAALASAYFVGTSRLGARAALGAGLVAVLGPQLAMALEPTRWTLQSYVSYAGMLVAAWVVGRTIRVRLAAASDARRQLARLDERRREIEERAVAAERARLARELHDVVGHSILVICIQAGAAERLAEHDEDGAREAIASARTAAATAMRELDRLSRLMPVARAADGPGLADLPALAEDPRTTGVDVELRLIVAQPVPPALGATVYRIVQEALTNVAKHAAGSAATVAIEARGDRLLVRVSNAAGEAIPQDSGGHGLRNMRERAAEHGGALVAGEDGDGGWAVTAAFPLRSAHDVATMVG